MVASMRTTFQRAFLLLLSLTTSLLAADSAWAREHTQRLRSPATVRSFIGGESHNSYVIRARKGQTLTVQISWRREHDADIGDNHAEFWVGELPDFDGNGEVKFGKESDEGTRWSGRIPKTGDYYIYVMAHPTAHYTLRITAK